MSVPNNVREKEVACDELENIEDLEQAINNK